MVADTWETVVGIGLVVEETEKVEDGHERVVDIVKVEDGHKRVVEIRKVEGIVTVVETGKVDTPERVEDVDEEVGVLELVVNDQEAMVEDAHKLLLVL